MASVWSGSADSSNSIVTTVAVDGTGPSSAGAGSACAVTAGSSGARCSTEVTLPTLTPAIRTGEAGRTLPAFVNTASTVYLSAQGSDFVKA